VNAFAFLGEIWAERCVVLTIATLTWRTSEMNLKKMRVWLTAIAVFAVALSIAFLAVPVRAQLAGANLSGVVSDESGAAVAGATVTIRNTATGDVREVRTNTDGIYAAPNLAPGTYDVAVTAPGFGQMTQKGLALNVGGEQSLDFKIKIGQRAQ